MPNIKSRWRGGVLEFYDLNSQETVERFSAIQFQDDFLGADLVIPASAESGCFWRKSIVGAAPPTVAYVANETNGVVACSLTSDAQAQSAILYTGDQLTIDSGQGLIVEMRVKLSVLPTLVAECFWGIGTATGVPDTIATSCFFTADGSGEIFCESDDSSTDVSATSGVTATAAQWKIYRIDMTNESDIKFYIDGVAVATGSTFLTAGKAQPFIGCYKASGAGLGVLQLDYIKAWSNRS